MTVRGFCWWSTNWSEDQEQVHTRMISLFVTDSAVAVIISWVPSLCHFRHMVQALCLWRNPFGHQTYPGPPSPWAYGPLAVWTRGWNIGSGTLVKPRSKLWALFLKPICIVLGLSPLHWQFQSNISMYPTLTTLVIQCDALLNQCTQNLLYSFSSFTWWSE